MKRIATKTKLLKVMADYDACDEATEWVSEQSGTPAEIWAKCPRADWMLWFAGQREIERKTLVRASCACARAVLHLVPEGETRSRQAIEVAEAWCRDEASLTDVRRAARAAYAAASAACVAYAAYAADAAARAAYTADAVAYAADAVAYAAAYTADAVAYAAAYAAYAADYAAYAARYSVDFAALVREHITVEVLGLE